MNLKAYVGKTVLLQFKAGQAWLAAHIDGGQAAILAVKRPVEQADGTVTEELGFMPTPFLIGTVTERRPTDAYYDDDNVILLIKDPNGQLEVIINPDVIACVTVAMEAPRVQIVGG